MCWCVGDALARLSHRAKSHHLPVCHSWLQATIALPAHPKQIVGQACDLAQEASGRGRRASLANSQSHAHADTHAAESFLSRSPLQVAFLESRLLNSSYSISPDLSVSARGGGGDTRKHAHKNSRADHRPGQMRESAAAADGCSAKGTLQRTGAQLPCSQRLEQTVHGRVRAVRTRPHPRLRHDDRHGGGHDAERSGVDAAIAHRARVRARGPCGEDTISKHAVLLTVDEFFNVDGKPEVLLDDLHKRLLLHCAPPDNTQRTPHLWQEHWIRVRAKRKGTDRHTPARKASKTCVTLP